MKTFVREITWIDYVDHGWGNGYVAVPPTSKLHGLEYDGVDVSVHGGVTYSNLAAKFYGKPDDIPDDWWIFGFDTAHGLDNQLMHDKQYVLNETQSLLEQLKKLERE